MGRRWLIEDRIPWRWFREPLTGARMAYSLADFPPDVVLAEW